MSETARDIPCANIAPSLLWIGAALYLLPEDSKIRPILIRIWAVASIPLVMMARQ